MFRAFYSIHSFLLPWVVAIILAGPLPLLIHQINFHTPSNSTELSRFGNACNSFLCCSASLGSRYLNRDKESDVCSIVVSEDHCAVCYHLAQSRNRIPFVQQAFLSFLIVRPVLFPKFLVRLSFICPANPPRGPPVTDS